MLEAAYDEIPHCKYYNEFSSAVLSDHAREWTF